MNISWLALDVNILDDTKIKLIRKYPDGDRLFILWIGLLCLAMRSENTGLVEISPGIPYSPEDLATLFDLEIKTVQFGLKLFSSERFQMILLTEGSTIEICNFMKYQRYDRVQRVREQTRERVARFREARKLLVSSNKIEDGNALLTQEKRSCNDTQYNNNTNTDTKQKERERGDAHAKHRFGEFKNVTLMDHELEKLKIDHGDDQTLKAIEFLSSYKASKHYPTKSDYLTIKRWVFEALKERRPGRQNRIDQIVQNWRAKHELNELDKAFLPIAQLGFSPDKPSGGLVMQSDNPNPGPHPSWKTDRENAGDARERTITIACHGQREDVWAIHGSRHVHGFGSSQVMESGPLDGGFPLRE